MFLCRLSAWLLLLLLALNCKTALETSITKNCLLRICTGHYAFYANSTSHPSPLDVLQEEVKVIDGLVRLMPATTDASLYCSTNGFSSGGIECNYSLGSQGLPGDLSDKDLYGQIPKDIGVLTQLRSLDLSGNELYGRIPESFGNLTQLSFLNLCDNKLEGPVPSSFGQIKSLETLYLCSNRFSGSIPSELVTLPSLQYLNIRINSLSGSIPNELWSNTGLIRLDLQDNQLVGQLPEQLGNGSNLETIYLMNNNFTGELPLSIGNLTKLRNFNIEGNNFNGAIPHSIADLQDLQLLGLMGNNFQGPVPSNMSAKLNYLAVTDLAGGGRGYPFPEIQNGTLLQRLTLRKCSLTGSIPDFIWHLRYLNYLDLSFNNLTGGIPPGVDIPLRMIFFRRNKLNGSLPGWLANLNHAYVDLSENFFTNVTPSTGIISPNMNLFECCSNINNVDMKWQEAKYYCANNSLTYDRLYINCGGNGTSINGSYYEADLQPNGGSTFFLSDNKAWAYSSMGKFLSADSDQYIVNKTCNISMADAPLYTGARVSPISLKYYGLCLRNDKYTVRVHFAEIGWDATIDSSIKRSRIFDVEIQGDKVLRDFNIEEAAGGLDKDITKEYNISVKDNRLEIHLYWSGKGSITFPTKYYGPLISAISVSPVPKEHHKFSSGEIAGIVGSSGFFLVLIFALFWKLGWLGGKRHGVELYLGGAYNFQQIRAATNNFKNKIGEGRGTVYKGVLPDGVEIAVKRLSPKSIQRAREIINEIGTIYTLQHQNLARPMGNFSEKNQILLVYEYMENISLQNALFDSEEVKSRLNWQTRVKICIGMAKGLAFLHEESELNIIHSNIKPSNILLDKDFNVKISDFGYAELHDAQVTNAQRNEQGATGDNMPRAKITGYMAPEQIQGFPLTPKVDVYSFGIVALEIVSGREIITPRSKDQNIYLLNMAYQYLEQNNLIALVDSRLGKEYKTKEANTILDLAMACVSPSFDIRPTMSHAVKVLEGKIKLKAGLTSVAPFPDSKMAEPLATSSRSTQSGSSQERSNAMLSLSTSKEIDDDSILSAD